MTTTRENQEGGYKEELARQMEEMAASAIVLWTSKSLALWVVGSHLHLRHQNVDLNKGHSQMPYSRE